jgi:hypothetical protein
MVTPILLPIFDSARAALAATWRLSLVASPPVIETYEHTQPQTCCTRRLHLSLAGHVTVDSSSLHAAILVLEEARRLLLSRRSLHLHYLGTSSRYSANSLSPNLEPRDIEQLPRLVRLKEPPAQ